MEPERPPELALHGLYESEGKAQTNIPLTLPAADSALARQLVRDPQVFKEHNRVLVRIHLEKFGLPMGVTDYQIKRLLPTVEQLAKCYVDTEAQLADTH